MMKIKDLLKTLLVCLLIFSMLASVACSKSNTTGECTHKDVKIENQKDATCLEEGYSGDKICKSCGKTVSKGKTIAPTDHQWDEGIVTKTPTCVSTGVKTVTCKTCFITESQVLETVACDSAYHFEANEKHRLVCNVCYKSTNGDHTKSETIKTVAASCLEDGYTLYHCADCDCDFKEYDSTKPATGHEWDVENPVIDPATCSSEGSQYYICKNEGCEEHTTPYTLKIAPGVHTFEIIESQVATCASTGYEIYRCSGCGAEKEKVLAKLPHAYGEAVESDGWKFKECDCGHRISAFDASGSDNATLDVSGTGGEALEITFNNATVEFPSSVIGNLNNSNVSVNAGFVGSDIKDGLLSSSAMSDEDKGILSGDSSKIYDFSIAAGDENIHNFDENVTITLPYTLSENEDAEGIVIWYVAPDGELDSISDVLFYDPDGDGVGQVIFEVEHFSYYAIAYKETPEMRCRRGVHDYSNEALWTDVEATCTFYGFTAKECKVCGTTSLDNFTAMKDHRYGAMVTPQPDCENGRYKHQTCEDCGLVKNYDYIPAIGHNLVSYATCDSSAVCGNCYKILIPAYGHNWSDWQVVVEANDTTAGLKRRFCPICGEFEDVKIPVKVDIEAWNITSYQGFVETVVNEVGKIGNGKATIKIEQDGRTYDIQFTVNKDGDVYTAYIKSNVTYRDETDEYEVYYKNGKMAVIGDGDTVISDVDHIAVMFPDFEKYYSYIKSAITYYDRDVSEAFEMIGKLIDEYVETYGKNANDKLKANGKDYTVEELRDAYKGLNALYVYYIYKLGVESASGMPQGVEVPTAKNLHNVLEFFMTKSEEGGNSVYTYDFSTIKQNYLDQIKLAEDQANKTLDKVIYDNFADLITVHYPKLTDWSKLMSHLRSEFGGSVKVQTLIDKIVSVAENSGACSADELYDIIGKAFAFVAREEVDFELMAEEYSNYTLDEMITMALGEVDEETGDKISMKWFFDKLDESVRSTKLGDIVVDSYGEEEYNPETGHHEYTRVEITYSDRIADIKESINRIDYEGEARIVLDADGNIVDFKYNQISKNTYGEGNESETVQSTNDIRYAPTTEKVSIPEALKKYLDMNVTFTKDSQGNLTISGVPADYELELDLYGYVSMSIADKVEKSVALSNEYGIDVFMLNEKYWSETVYVGDYLMDADGNFYEYAHSSEHFAEFKAMAPFKDFEADPAAFLPKDGDEAAGCFRNDNGDIVYLYSTVAGLFYKENGSWMAVTDNNGGYYSDEYGCYYFYGIHGESFDALCENLVISNINTRGIYYNENKESFIGGKLYIQGLDYNNWELNIVLIGSEIYLVERDFTKHQEVYVLGNLVSEVPDYDIIENNSKYYDEEDKMPVIKDDEEVEGYDYVSLYKRVPTYYATYDGYYFNMSSYYSHSSTANYRNPFVYVNVEGMETHTLPDGRVVYVVNRSGDIEREGTVFGFIPVTKDLYAQAACIYKEGNLDHVAYRGSADGYESATKYRRDDIEEVININDYVTRANGTITVSAAALEMIQNNCNRFGDSVSLTLEATDAASGVRVAMCYNVYANYMGEYNPETIIEERIDWSEHFDIEDVSSNNYQFSVKVLDNGDIEITLPDANKVIDIRFEFNMSEVEADDVLIPNDYKTQNYGYEIYTAKEYNRYWDRYVKYNNAYYYYDYVYVARGYNRKTADQILKENWYLDDIDYQYDEINEQGEILGRIYRATLYFDSGVYSSSSASINVKIVDGKMYVLTGVSHESDMGLMYEGMVEYADFVNGLTLVENNSGVSDYVYYDDNKKLNYTSFAIKYQEEWLTTVEYFFYMNNGQRQYIKCDNYDHIMVPSLNSPVTLPAGWNQTAIVDMNWNNMNYQIVSGIYNRITSNDYVKIGDKYISIHNAYIYDMRNTLMNIAEQQYIYGVYNGSNWVYYSDYEWNYQLGMIVPVGEPIAINDSAFLFRDSYIGEMSGGYSCYSFDYYDASTIEIQTLSNGVEVYCQPGTTNDCYAKLTDDVFVRGYLLDEGNGYSFIPENWYHTEFDSRELAGALNLNASIKVSGNKAVVSKNILDKLAEYQDSVRIEFYGIHEYSEYYESINYSELSAWFN